MGGCQQSVVAFVTHFHSHVSVQLQSPQSFGQSVQELVIALQRTGDPGSLSLLRPHLELLSALDPSPGGGRRQGVAHLPLSWRSAAFAIPGDSELQGHPLSP